MKTFVALMVLLVAAGSAWAESYEYDAAGRLAKVTYADGKTIDYRYDSSGNVVEVEADPPLEDPPVDPPLTKPTGCGCAAAEGGAIWGLLLGAGLLRRRQPSRIRTSATPTG
jgi:MYXO-CTERM domain-containing protein